MNADGAAPPATGPMLRSSVAGVAWPALPGPAGEALLALLYQLEQSQWWPQETLRKSQWTQLCTLLEHARHSCPWYQEHLPRDLDPGDWHEIPILSRAQLQREPEVLQSAVLPEAHGRRLRFSTTGSTSRPIEVERSDLAVLMAESMVVRDHLWQRRDLTARLAVVSAKVERGEHADWGGAVSSAFDTGPAVTLNIRHDPWEQLDWLRQQRPAYLLSHPSNLDALARLALERGTALPGLCQVRSFGEALPDGIRERVKKAWGVPLSDTYSCEEVGTIALQCPEHDHYHVMAEHLLVEVVDEQGHPCRPGEWGRVLLTTLHNLAMPLIRYELGDYAEVGEACSCGRGLPVLRRILGRRRNLLITPDGRCHWPSFPARIWLPHPAIREFRLVQTRPERIRVELVTAAPLEAAALERLAADLRESLDYSFELEFAFLDALPEIAGHKREDFVSLLEAGNAVPAP